MKSQQEYFDKLLQIISKHGVDASTPVRDVLSNMSESARLGRRMKVLQKEIKVREFKGLNVEHLLDDHLECELEFWNLKTKSCHILKEMSSKSDMAAIGNVLSEVIGGSVGKDIIQEMKKRGLI